jgi:DNA repair protein RecO (recombination protein O)
MDWHDEGILLAVRPHGESSVIIEALTRAHGRHAGLVYGGQGTRLAPVLQPGAQLALEWRARLAEHLGHYRVEPLRSRAAAIMGDRAALAALNAIGALAIAFLPEREPDPALYDETLALADALAARAWNWPALYARWELSLLAALGFGLDLARCAATGERDDLAFVSPRSGRAVSRGAGAVWSDRMLPLPEFLLGRGAPDIAAVRAALRTTGHFLETRACPAFEREALPEARARLVRLLERHAMAAPHPRHGDSK